MVHRNASAAAVGAGTTLASARTNENKTRNGRTHTVTDGFVPYTYGGAQIYPSLVQIPRVCRHLFAIQTLRYLLATHPQCEYYYRCSPGPRQQREERARCVRGCALYVCECGQKPFLNVTLETRNGCAASQSEAFQTSICANASPKIAFGILSV
jgi:hypothetical protein